MNYLEELIKTIEILRSPQGCEWDRQQTHQTIRQNMLEEAYEAAEATAVNTANATKTIFGLPLVFFKISLASQVNMPD